ncbi:MAG: single-stranded DNA-binding protein [Cyanobacteriota bacterium]|nr:single-stranded DNA-binding protein [Cyanobacteriota bacterium]
MSNQVLNRVALSGRLGQAVEIRYFNSGSVLAKGSLAVDNPASKDHPFWFPLEIWGRAAEVAANYTAKGSLIGVEGELKLESWQQQDGQQRVKPVVRVQRLHLMEKNPNQQQSPNNVQSPFPPITY